MDRSCPLDQYRSNHVSASAFRDQPPMLIMPGAAAHFLERRNLGSAVLAAPIPIRPGCAGTVQFYYHHHHHHHHHQQQQQQLPHRSPWLPFGHLYPTGLHGPLTSGNGMFYLCSKSHLPWSEPSNLNTATTVHPTFGCHGTINTAVSIASGTATMNGQTTDRKADRSNGLDTGQSLLPADGVDRFRCAQCKRRFDSDAALRLHTRAHIHGSKCPICGKTFTRHWLIQGHLRTHTGEKPFKCHVCDKAFADKSNLRAHVQTHSGLKPFSCRRCGRGFALKSYLSKHEESACQNRVINMVSYRKIDELLL